MNLHYSWKSFLLSEMRPLADDAEINQVFNDKSANDCVNVAKTFKTSIYLRKLKVRPTQLSYIQSVQQMVTGSKQTTEN